tara:strand:- start:2137 stop:3438 length:1302 start_codon:yes stop_codon:yes gene_type:complete
MHTDNENISYLKKCKICENNKLKEVVKLEEQYISATFVKSNKNNRLAKIKTHLTLVLCDSSENKNNCGLLQLLEITNPDLLYKQYFYRSATSDTMRADLKDVVKQSMNIARPSKKEVIVDIGSNDCTLLNFYGKEFTLVGFEPAQNIKYIDKGNNINIFSNYFNAKDYNKKFKKKAKIITSCAMFYDLEKPKKFVKDIEEILDDDGVWCCQISYVLSMLKFNNFYDICHEHLSYYSIDSFEHLLKDLNLKCFYAETNNVNGGSIRLFVCKKNSKKYNKEEYVNKLLKLKREEEKYDLKNPQTFINFQKNITEIKNKTNVFVDQIIKSDKKVLALGASTKGNVLLQHFGLDKTRIPFISERNPEKVGLRCLGSDIELISEETARSINPKAFVVLPWNFKDEIVKREKKYVEHGGQLMFAMPYPHVVTKKGEIKL